MINQSTDYQVYTNEKKNPETMMCFQECEGIYLGHGICIDHGIEHDVGNPSHHFDPTGWHNLNWQQHGHL
jgi:hypothetical protein